MAEGKKSFMLYADMIGVFEKLPDDKAGQLIKHVFRYVNDQNPETDDLILNIAFEPIKTALKRDLKRWWEKCGKNRENILKRWNKNNTVVYGRIPNDTKHTDSDNDSDNDSEKDNIIKEYFGKFWDVYPKRNGKKVGKQLALKQFKKIKAGDYETVIRNAKNYGVNNDYPKDPERFLKNDFWKDWDTPQEKKGGGYVPGSSWVS